METPVIICLDATRLNSCVYEPVLGDLSAVRLAERQAAALQQATGGELVGFTDDTTRHTPPGRVVHHAQWSEQTLTSALAECSAGKGRHASLVVLRADAPLLLRDETDALLQQHQHYFAHYSFCDGYPSGCTPEVVSADAVPLLQGLAQSDVPFSSLFSVVERDINSFDIETRISPRDYRLLRLVFRTDSRRNHLLCRRILEAMYPDELRVSADPGGLTAAADHAADTDSQLLRQVLDSNPGLFRTLPASLNWVLHGASSRPAGYMPHTSADSLPLSRQPAADAALVVSSAREFAELAGDGTLVLSHVGEPAEYPGITGLVADCAATGLKIVVETDGIGWDSAAVNRLADDLQKRGQLDAVTWIVFLDAHDPDVYARIRPNANLEQALAGYEILNTAFPDTVYVQATRMQLNEAHLLEFYRYWKERTERIIVQKYNRYAGKLPDQQVADTSPIQRMPCWRLKREITVLPDGSMAMCHVDLFDPQVFGRIGEQPLSELWERHARMYQLHLETSYPALCVNCDEYYTFTF